MIDGVEGTYTKTEGADAAAIKLIGNVPASGKAPGGMLRHKGWQGGESRSALCRLPATLLAPAEIEIE